MKKRTLIALIGFSLILILLICSSILGYTYLRGKYKRVDIVQKVENIPEPHEDFNKILNEENSKEDVKGTTSVTIPKGYVKIPVLMYHQIGAIPNTGSYNYKGLYVTPYMFEQQMKYLVDHNYKTITPEQFYTYLKSGKTPKQKVVLLTFDDGSKGQYTYAYPILKKYHLTGTFYIISNRSPISNTQLKRMSDAGMVIDSHSTLHEDLRVLNDKKQLKYEIDSSKKKLESITGKSIVSIAYPGCVADSQAFNQVASSGYKLGFSCGRTIYHTFSHRLYLSRVHIYSNMNSFTKALTVGL